MRGRGHAASGRESLLNTPLFAGFPGFVSKLWLAGDEIAVRPGGHASFRGNTAAPGQLAAWLALLGPEWPRTRPIVT